MRHGGTGAEKGARMSSVGSSGRCYAQISYAQIVEARCARRECRRTQSASEGDDPARGTQPIQKWKVPVETSLWRR
jgi:hypothetical protein